MDRRYSKGKEKEKYVNNSRRMFWKGRVARGSILKEGKGRSPSLVRCGMEGILYGLTSTTKT